MRGEKRVGETDEQDWQRGFGLEGSEKNGGLKGLMKKEEEDERRGGGRGETGAMRWRELIKPIRKGRGKKKFCEIIGSASAAQDYHAFYISLLYLSTL